MRQERTWKNFLCSFSFFLIIIFPLPFVLLNNFALLCKTKGIRWCWWRILCQARVWCVKRKKEIIIVKLKWNNTKGKFARVCLKRETPLFIVTGNYWILGIMWPDYAPTLFEPNRWCHKILYRFALIHLCIVYSAIGVSVLVALGLTCCRIFACPWPERWVYFVDKKMYIPIY